MRSENEGEGESDSESEDESRSRPLGPFWADLLKPEWCAENDVCRGGDK